MSGVFISLDEPYPTNEPDNRELTYGFWSNEYPARLWFVFLAREMRESELPFDVESWTKFLTLPSRLDFLSDDSAIIFATLESRKIGAQISTELISKLKKNKLMLADFYPHLASSVLVNHYKKSWQGKYPDGEVLDENAKQRVIDVGEHFLALLNGELDSHEASLIRAGVFQNLMEQTNP